LKDEAHTALFKGLVRTAL